MPYAAAQRAQTTGILSKRPVFAGACPYCPWGAIAEVVKEAMKPNGYDVQICYVCAKIGRASCRERV